MTKEEALLFQARWALVNQRTTEEIRDLPVMSKLRQLAQMFAASQQLGWSERTRASEKEVRERWQQLREKMHGR